MDDLDTHPNGFGDDSAGSESSSKLPLLGLIIGLVGIVLGLGGIFMGAQAGNALRDYQESLAARPDTTGQRISNIDIQIEQLREQMNRIPRQLESIEERLASMGSAQVALQRADREIRDQTQRALDNVTREVSSNRSQLNATTERLEELIDQFQASRRPSAPVASTPTTTTSTPSYSYYDDDDTPQRDTTPEGVHVVESGDTLSSIANRYGVSLSQLMAANPGVDPRRMRIGQHIVIPAR